MLKLWQVFSSVPFWFEANLLSHRKYDSVWLSFKKYRFPKNKNIFLFVLVVKLPLQLSFYYLTNLNINAGCTYCGHCLIFLLGYYCFKYVSGMFLFLTIENPSNLQTCCVQKIKIQFSVCELFISKIFCTSFTCLSWFILLIKNSMYLILLHLL